MSLINSIAKIPVLGVILRKVKFLLSKQQPVIKSVRGVNNRIHNAGTFKNVVIDIVGNHNSVVIGTGTFLQDALIFIRGEGHKIEIGEHCVFAKGELWIEDSHGTLRIGNNSSIEHAHLAVTEPGSVLEIQEDCMLAKHIEIRTGDSHSIIDMATGDRINYAANVTLEKHVWVGAHAKILKGVTIGHNSIIATSALVTSDVPPHSIAAGVPAKVIKQGIDWKRERIFKL